MSAPTPRPANLMRQWDGPLTRELALAPGRDALGHLPARLQPDRIERSICGYCSTGCSLDIHLREDLAINLTPTLTYPVNLGMACPKGWEALTPLKANDRATVPLLRDENGVRQPVAWETAMETFTNRFKAIQEKHGAHSIAWLGTGQIPCEELAFLGAFAKFGMGILHGDGNTRQCMATAVAAYKQAFGFDAPPFTYADFEESDTIVLVGSNLCIAHPILWQRVLQNQRQPEIIVIDPRRTETAMAATQHLPILPKSDLSLLYGLARELIERNWLDAAFVEANTNGFAEFKTFVTEFTPERMLRDTGLTKAAWDAFVAAMKPGRRLSFWWTMGVNQGHQAVRTAQALINLALMTGNIGKPGTGANSITGQCNAMGSRLFSNTTNLIGGHEFTNPAHREKIASLLDIPLERIPTQNSWSYDQIIQGIDDGKIKGLWIVATNSAHSWINQTAARATLAKLEFLVVQDMYSTTETADLAHLVLPAAGWGEKEGTFINSERRFGLIKKVAKAPGQALSDFNIVRLAAHYWGCGELFSEWSSPENVFQIMKRVSQGQPCDITGIHNFRMLDALGGVQWPLPQVTNGTGEQKIIPGKERRLFADGRFFTPDAKAKFLFELPEPPPEAPCAAYPFMLLTGRGTSAQWHTQTRTGKSDVLRKLYPAEVYVEISIQDAANLEIDGRDWIEIASRRGKIRARALVTSTIQPGQVFLPMHYAEVNQLTFPAFDPHSRQPSYKAAAVSLTLCRKEKN